MVQFRPCLSDTQKKNKQKAIKRNQTNKRSTYRASLKAALPVIETPIYERIGLKMGRWTGKVTGSGKVHLALHILSNGKLLKKKYMGNVILGKNKQEEGVKFSFTSRIPTNSSWAWQILAYL